jgi:predicted DNA-binding protein (MmcQ/YjbR family)
MTEALETRAKLLAYALTFPEAYEDHPWGEVVVKVNKKVFLFLGVSDGSYPPSFCLKLIDSNAQGLAVPGAAPAGYGLGKSGWVQVPLETELPPVEVLHDWIDESYRLVAPKRLVKELDDCTDE